MGSSLYGAQGPTGKFSGDVVPKGYKTGQLQQFTPEQMQLFQQLFSQVAPGSFLQRLAGGDEGIFQEMEAPAMRQFQGTLGNIASKFSGMGLGGRRSSGFQNETSSAASNFAQELAANRQGLQRQAIQDLMGISSQLLSQKPYEKFLRKKQPSFWEKILGAFSPVGGDIAGGGTENTEAFIQALMSMGGG